MKALSILLIFGFLSSNVYSQEYSRAEECDLLLSDLIEAFDDSFNPLYLKYEKQKSELDKLESFLKEALESKDKNTRRVVIAITSGVASVTLGYFAFRNIKTAVPSSLGGIIDPTRMPLYWRIILGVGAVAGTGYAITQGRDFFLTNKQVKRGMKAVAEAQAKLEQINGDLNKKMCEANQLIVEELEAEQCASVGLAHFQCTN